ncbi:hypothetical protein N657DRAFT_326338 [Parathielavia appendiculata]|uniref:Bromo domain-containing protein n=1 Tax=Parathielavia appendiculata TaxID=2587402 RepID=A0AAN6TQI2_9PEZI|nr:hypothetical protein N657DRAFT_326338 [Parathielavia appendiculata]
MNEKSSSGGNRPKDQIFGEQSMNRKFNPPPTESQNNTPAAGTNYPAKEHNAAEQRITEWQTKQTVRVLADVEKTKIRTLFRLPVQQLFPCLSAIYSTKVSNPTDISTMGKRLRGDAPRGYATMGEFKQDLELMVQSSVTFSGEHHDTTAMARACRDRILMRMAVHPGEPTTIRSEQWPNDRPETKVGSLIPNAKRWRLLSPTRLEISPRRSTSCLGMR